MRRIDRNKQSDRKSVWADCFRILFSRLFVPDEPRDSFQTDVLNKNQRREDKQYASSGPKIKTQIINRPSYSLQQTDNKVAVAKRCDATGTLRRAFSWAAKWAGDGKAGVGKSADMRADNLIATPHKGQQYGRSVTCRAMTRLRVRGIFFLPPRRLQILRFNRCFLRIFCKLIITYYLL